MSDPTRDPDAGRALVPSGATAPGLEAIANRTLRRREERQEVMTSGHAERLERWLTWYRAHVQMARFLTVEALETHFVQWDHNDDGSLHAEVSPDPMTEVREPLAERRLPDPQHGALIGRGYTPPGDGWPNYWRTWPPGTPTSVVAAEAVWALESVHGVPVDAVLTARSDVLVPD